MLKRVPAYIITGFLGSGKTTVLLHLLNYCKEKSLKPAIVLNEIGDTNVEKNLFNDENMLEMLNGCICCSIQEDFTKELHSFLESLNKAEKPDLLIIEGTGIANPLEIVDALTHPLLIDAVELYSVINLIDASKYLEYRSIFSSSKEVRDVLKSQIETSTLILLNKVDLINDKMIKKVNRKVEEGKRNDTPILTTSYGQVEPELLLKKRIDIYRSTDKESLKCGCSSNHTCSTHEKENNHSFQAIKIELKNSIDRLELEAWLKQLPKTIVRSKGIVTLTETVGLFQFQYASNQLHLNRIKTEKAISPCIILIGINMDRNQIETSFWERF